MAGQGLADDLVGVDVTFLDDFADVDVLDRVMVRTELEATTSGSEISFFQRRAERISILHVRLGHGRQQQIGGIEALRSVKRRQAAVLGLEALNKGLVGRGVDVLAPLAGVLDTECRIANGLQNALIKGESRSDDRQVDTGVLVLLQEGDPMPPGRKK